MVTYLKKVLRRDLELMDRFVEEMNASVEAVISSLSGYRRMMMEVTGAEKVKLAEAAGAAIQEADTCANTGSSPNLPLTKALLALAPEELTLFTYTVTPLDISSLLEELFRLFSYTNTLPSICGEQKALPDFNSPRNIFIVHPIKAALFNTSLEIPILLKDTHRYCLIRVNKEIRELLYRDYDSRSIVYSPQENDFCDLIAELLGPENSPYAGLIFTLAITIPEDYPYKPYKIDFVTPIYHPNITDNGCIYSSLLSDEWRVPYTLRTVLLSIGAILGTPEPDCVANLEAANEYLSNPQSFEANARLHALKHARIQGSRK